MAVSPIHLKKLRGFGTLTKVLAEEENEFSQNYSNNKRALRNPFFVAINERSCLIVLRQPPRSFYSGLSQQLYCSLKFVSIIRSPVTLPFSTEWILN
jgi:hypothetical protein